MDDATLKNIHKHSFRNKNEIINSDICGCFCCGNMFLVENISEWIDSGETALCPFCFVDSILGSSCNFIINKELLREMHKHYFNHNASF